jgi:hypothetical protein
MSSKLNRYFALYVSVLGTVKLTMRMDLDKKNGNNFWQEAEATDMRQFLEYITIIDKGKNCTPTSNYKNICCYMVYDVKHDGRHKDRLVAGGNLTDPNTESVTSGVVFLRGIRLIVFLAELNGFELLGSDVKSSYLTSYYSQYVF